MRLCCADDNLEASFSFLFRDPPVNKKKKNKKMREKCITMLQYNKVLGPAALEGLQDAKSVK